MKYRETHFRVNSIYKQMQYLHNQLEEEKFKNYKIASKVKDIQIECADLKASLFQVQGQLNDLINSQKMNLMRLKEFGKKNEVE